MDVDEMPSSSTQARKASDVDKLTKTLQGWKEFLNLCQRILLWEKPYFGYCIAGVVTIEFFLWWYLDASLVTTFASLVLLLVTADFAIPSVGSKLLFGRPWDGEQERRFESVCRQLLSVRDAVYKCWDYARQKKATNSVAYICAVSGTLFFLGLLGHYVNNTFLCYVVVLALSLFPGLKHHGHIDQLTKKVTSLLPASKQKKN